MGTSVTVQVCRDIIPLSRAQLCRAHIPIAHTCLSCAPNSIIGDIASLSCLVGRLCRAHCAPVVRAWPSLSCAHGLRTPSPVVCNRTFCHGQLCRDRNSPYPGQLYCDIELLCRDIISPCLGQLYRNLKIICRDRKSSQPDQLYRDIELLCRNTKPLHLATLCHDIKTFRRDRKLLAWPTLSRPKSIMSGQKTL